MPAEVGIEPRRCDVCRVSLRGRRSDARHCSAACRAVAFRQRATGEAIGRQAWWIVLDLDELCMAVEAIRARVAETELPPGELSTALGRVDQARDGLAELGTELLRAEGD